MKPRLKRLNPKVALLSVALIFLALLDAFFVITFKPAETPLPVAVITVEKGAVVAPENITVGREAIVIEVAKEGSGEEAKAEDGEVVNDFAAPAPDMTLLVPVPPKKAPAPLVQKTAKTTDEVDDVCAKEALKEAVTLRSIQSKLMVAALSCQGARKRYNDFALKYQKPLNKNGTLIMGYFKCKAGRKATVQFDAMITKIANLASALNSEDHDDFCDEAMGVFDDLEEGDPDDLPTLALRHSYLDESFTKEY